MNVAKHMEGAAAVRLERKKDGVLPVRCLPARFAPNSRRHEWHSETPLFLFLQSPTCLLFLRNPPIAPHLDCAEQMCSVSISTPPEQTQCSLKGHEVMSWVMTGLSPCGQLRSCCSRCDRVTHRQRQSSEVTSGGPPPRPFALLVFQCIPLAS